MGKLVFLENGQIGTFTWYVWALDGKTYQALNVTGMTQQEALALLPCPTPNYVQQIARTADEAVDFVRRNAYESLFSQPVPTSYPSEDM